MLVQDFSQPVVLGKTGLKTRRMGIGADAGVPAAALEWAFERGVNYFYWGTRRRKGMEEAIRRLAPGRRESMIIALQSYDYTGLALKRTFHQGLRRLKIDYADVFILGMRNGPIPARIVEQAAALKEKGLVRHLCVSAHDRTAYQDHLALGVFDLIMVRYNAAHRGAEKEVFPLLPEKNRPGVICFNSTRWGHLFSSRWTPEGEKPPRPVDLYRYVLSNPSIDMVLTAPRTLDQMRENLKTLESSPISDEERRWLERVGDHMHALNPSTNFDFLFQLAPKPKSRAR